MKKERLSLNAVKNVLSRSELKTIMAGSTGGGGGGGGGTCVIPCAPTCSQTFVGVWCYSASGYLGYTTSNSCNSEALLQHCYMAGFSATTHTTSSCVC